MSIVNSFSDFGCFSPILATVKNYALDLYEVEEGGEAKILKSTPFSRKWISFVVQSIGDISYKDGLLCWSAFEDIFCESWPRTGDVPAIKHVLHEGDARSVCIVSGKSLLFFLTKTNFGTAEKLYQ